MSSLLYDNGLCYGQPSAHQKGDALWMKCINNNPVMKFHESMIYLSSIWILTELEKSITESRNTTLDPKGGGNRLYMPKDQNGTVIISDSSLGMTFEPKNSKNICVGIWIGSASHWLSNEPIETMHI